MLAPLILLHDSLGCVDLWGSFPAALARATNREVIAYDRLGYGRSTARRTPLAPDFIREEAEVYFPHLITALGLKRFALMGHSVGGGMAITIAALNPAACVGVISESAQALIEDRTVTGIVAARRAFEDPPTFARLTAVHGDKASTILRTWSEAWLALDPREWRLTRGLPPLRSPLLVLHGERDEFGTLANVRLLQNYGGPSTTVVVHPGVAHIPHRECRDDVLNAIKNFGASLP